MGLHRRGHSVEIPGKLTNFILGLDRNPLAVAPGGNLVRCLRQPSQRSQPPAQEPANRQKAQHTNHQRQQSEPTSQLQQLGMNIGRICHKVNLALVFPNIQELPQNQILLSLVGAAGGFWGIFQRQVVLRGEGCRGRQALPVDDQSASCHTGGAEAMNQEDFFRKRLPKVCVRMVDCLPERIRQLL